MEQQEREYEMALTDDSEQQMRIRQEIEKAEAERIAAEKERMRVELEAENLRKSRIAAFAQLSPDPLSSSTSRSLVSGITELKICMPSGARITRCFLDSDTLASVKIFIEGTDLSIPVSYQLFTGVRRQNLAPDSLTLLDAGLSPRALVFVELS